MLAGSIKIYRLGKTFLAATLFSLVGGFALAEPAKIALGTWITKEQSHITIEECDTGLCGYISEIVVPPDMIAQYGEEAIASLDGQFKDFFNEDPALRDRPMLGLQILTLTEIDAKQNLVGKVYNPKDGKTYDGFVEVVSQDHIRLNGCVLYGRLCQGEDWHRAPEQDDQSS